MAKIKRDSFWPHWPVQPYYCLFSIPLSPLHWLLRSLHPHSAQVDRCLAGWPVIITVVQVVSSGWCWLFFEYFIARAGQDRTFPEAMGEVRRDEDTTREDRRSMGQKEEVYLFICLFLFLHKILMKLLQLSENNDCAAYLTFSQQHSFKPSL